MRSINFTLSISQQQYQQYYSGKVKFVLVTADDGRRVKFPADILRSLVTHDGIHGRFRIDFDDRHKFKRIVRL